MLRHWITLLLVSPLSLHSAQAFAPFPLQAAVVERGAEQEKRQAPDAESRFKQLHQEYLVSLKAGLEPDGQCTWDNMVVRREWGDMTEHARKDYLRAVHCLHNLPSRTPRREANGARTRFDDFAVAHYTHGWWAHRSPMLAFFHRQLLWRFEKALQQECHYKFGLPYWLWSKYLGTDPNTWPLFDGSDTSFSGNGSPSPNNCSCVRGGPLGDWQINIGPQGLVHGCIPNPQSDGLGYNPRCLERNFDVSQLEHTSYEWVVWFIENSQNADEATRRLEIESPALHGRAHLFMGGTMGDVAGSAQDAVFHSHHATIELLYDMWQSRDWDTRTVDLANPRSFDKGRAEQHWPLPTPDISLDTVIHLSSVFEDITVREAMWPQRNHYCYRYE